MDLNNLTAVDIIWLGLAGGFIFMVLAEYVQGRIDRKTDEAWRDGYEMGQSVVKGNRK